MMGTIRLKLHRHKLVIYLNKVEAILSIQWRRISANGALIPKEHFWNSKFTRKKNISCAVLGLGIN